MSLIACPRPVNRANPIYRDLLKHLLSGEDPEKVVSQIHDYLRDLGDKMRNNAIPAYKYTIYTQLGKNPQDYPNGGSMPSVQVALKLMDSSSLGLADQYDRFRQTHQELQRALKAIVNGKALPLYCMPRSSGADQRNRTPPRI